MHTSLQTFVSLIKLNIEIKIENYPFSIQTKRSCITIYNSRSTKITIQRKKTKARQIKEPHKSTLNLIPNLSTTFLISPPSTKKKKKLRHNFLRSPLPFPFSRSRYNDDLRTNRTSRSETIQKQTQRVRFRIRQLEVLHLHQLP